MTLYFMKTSEKRLWDLWNSILHIGHVKGMDQMQEMRLFTLNAFVVMASGLTLLFVIVFTLVGSYTALQGLFVLPAFFVVGYCNYKRKHTLAKILVIYLLLFLVLALALADRRTGTEYILIALGCTSVLLFERMAMILGSFVVALACYFFYSWYDATHVFVPDPSTPYVYVQNSLVLLSGVAIVGQSLVFRSLLKKYANSLKVANDEIGAVNEELKASNEELLSFSENLDLLVKQKSTELQAYIDAVNVNLYSAISDLQGVFTEVNQQIVLTSGYTREELVGVHYSKIGSGNYPHSYFLERRRVLMEGHSWRGEVEHKTKNGALLWFDCVIIPMRGLDGAIRSFLTLGLPITERKLHERMRDETNELLETIAFRASHNIRGPMARIKGLANLIEFNLLSESEHKTVASKFATCTEELNIATSELVNFVYDHQEVLNRDPGDYIEANPASVKTDGTRGS